MSFWAIFCPFSSLITWEIKILKLKKTPGDIISLHICTINDNHTMHGFWNMEWDRHNFLSFWTVFCRFTPYGPRKSKFWKIKKTPEHIIILHKCTINDNHRMYGSWDIERNRQIFLSFWTIFCPFPPLTIPKIKILKKWKKRNAWRYYHFTQVYQKSWSYALLILRHSMWQV